uniref:Uncharacterized protein n=1 Tax=Oncorhynchus tshawytscha TaxID=74940 RepID=A0A8C8ESV9_ONCTS
MMSCTCVGLPVCVRLCLSSWLGLAKALSQEEHLKNLGLWEPSEGPRWWTRSCSCRRKKSRGPRDRKCETEQICYKKKFCNLHENWPANCASGHLKPLENPKSNDKPSQKNSNSNAGTIQKPPIPMMNHPETQKSTDKPSIKLKV